MHCKYYFECNAVRCISASFRLETKFFLQFPNRNKRRFVQGSHKTNSKLGLIFYLTTTVCHFLSSRLSYQCRPLVRQHTRASGNGKRESSDTARTLPEALPTPESVGLQQPNTTSCLLSIDRGGDCYIPYLITPSSVESRWSRPTENSPRLINPTGTGRANSCVSS
jgi:hypothetical protein